MGRTTQHSTLSLFSVKQQHKYQWIMPSNSKKKNDVLSVTITVTDRALQRRPRCRVVNISLHSLRKDLSSPNKNLCTETSFSLRDAHSAVVSFIVLPVLPNIILYYTSLLCEWFDQNCKSSSNSMLQIVYLCNISPYRLHIGTLKPSGFRPKTIWWRMGDGYTGMLTGHFLWLSLGSIICS